MDNAKRIYTIQKCFIAGLLEILSELRMEIFLTFAMIFSIAACFYSRFIVFMPLFCGIFALIYFKNSHCFKTPLRKNYNKPCEKSSGIIYLSGQPKHLPIRIPKYADRIDLNDPKPGHKSYNQSQGIFYLGNDIEGYELWLKDTDIKTHMLVYGTTGSGKTVSLQSLAYNAFVLGTGLCYIDPKGDPKLAHEFFIMARRLGREDDFLSLDFMTGGKKIDDRKPFRMSNTFNPFAAAPADAIANLLISLIPNEHKISQSIKADAHLNGEGLYIHQENGNTVFCQKAMALLTALIPVLCSLRDSRQMLPLSDMSKIMNNDNWKKGELGNVLNINVIQNYLNPIACASLVYPVKNNGKEECDLIREFVDAPLLDILKAALTSLNYVQGKNISEQQAYFDQFAYAKGYFEPAIDSINKIYGHIFNVANGEIDMHDCLFNRRVLIGILPSLEREPQLCANLGKIVLTSMKNAVSGGLGDRLERSTKDITCSNPFSSRTPGIVIVDEYAAIMMTGFEVLLTQARSLGFMAIIASQDYSGMKNKNEKSCNQIVENTAFKLFMKSSGKNETWDLAKSLFGQIRLEEIDLTKEQGSVQKITTISQHDLMKQLEGEFHLFWNGRLIRGDTRYMVPRTENYHFVRINRWISADISPDVIFKNLEKKRREKACNID